MKWTKKLFCLFSVVLAAALFTAVFVGNPFDANVGNVAYAANAVSAIPAYSVSFNGHSYAVFDNSMMWQEAKEYCEDLGGYLVTITTQEEQEFLDGLIKKSSKNLYWIGLYLADDNWIWVNNESFSYSNWNEGEPNAAFEGTEDVVQMFSGVFGNGYLGKWNDSRNDSGGGDYTLDNVGFICEWDDTYTSKESDLKLTALVTPIGVCFDWTPSGNNLGYRIFRYETPEGEGVNISDFPIKGSSYFDANVNPNTTYYYTIVTVIAEASFDIETVNLIPEVLGTSSEMITVVTGDIKELEEEEEEEEVRRGFIMMTIGNPYMIVNEDTMVEIDPPGRGTAPIVLNGRTMVPIRAIVESMGGVVDWDASAERITLEAQKHTVTMTLGSKAITVDGAHKEMDIAPYLNDKDRTLLPVRFVAENLGTQIEWIASLERVVIVYAMENTDGSSSTED